MSKLDQELAEAILPKDGDAPALDKPIVTRAAPAEAPPRNLALLIALLLMVSGVLSLFLFGFKEAAIYAAPIETLAGKKDLVGRRVRVEGELVPGTLVKRDQPCEYRFTVHSQKDPSVTLAMRYPQCVIPDTFRDVPGGGVNVTVEGALSPQGDFEATLVMAKCTSHYDPKEHKMKDGPDLTGLPVN
jgi:cytochrome c-type biogenesis protein CcmE